MAELHVQPKRNKLWWLWILVVLIIVALVYFYFRGSSNQMALSETDVALTDIRVKQSETITTEDFVIRRVYRNSIYSRAIVRYIKEAKPIPIKLYSL